MAHKNVNHGSVVVSKHGLYVGSLGSIPTAVSTMTSLVEILSMSP